MNFQQYEQHKANLNRRGFGPEASATVVAANESYAKYINCKRCRVFGQNCETLSNGIAIVAFSICPVCGYIEEI